MKDDGNGNPDSTQTVKAPFSTQVQKWGELIVTLNLPPFQVKPLPGFTFSVKDATFDYSQISNPASIIFPNGYNSPVMPEPNSPFWEGIYVRELTITLPKGLDSTDNRRTSFQGTNLIIDPTGISGDFKGRHLLTLEKGKIANWQFSLDSVSVSLISGNLIQAGFKGAIKPPISKKPLDYNAIIHSNGDFLFNIRINEKMEIPMWVASAELYPNSSLEVSRIKSHFYPKAYLHGKMTVSPSGGIKASLADIAFEGLQIQTI